MTNLLKETKADIAHSGHVPTDIVFIGSGESGHRCTWDEFTKLADIEYDSGFGAQEVARDLMVVFTDGSSMWRHEYDGSECWNYSAPFTEPTESQPITTLVGGMWATLQEMNQPGGKYGKDESQGQGVE